MPNDKFKNLSREERDFLYHFVKTKSMFNAHRTSINFFLPEFNNTIYNTGDVSRILEKLTNSEYLSVSSEVISIKQDFTGRHPVVDLQYGIKDKSTYEDLYALFKIRIYLEKTFEYTKKIWGFLWEHFIITVLVSLATTYLAIRLFGKQ
jgi:hypothetical protein